MSVKTYTDTTRIIETIEEHVWEIHCDAISCLQQLRTTLGLQDRKEHGR